MSAPRPENDAARLSALRALQAADAVTEATFDDLTTLAAHICEAPLAFISLVEENRQLFRTQAGELGSTAREIAFCAHAIMQPDLFVIPDARADARFADNPMVTGDFCIRFYAGAPLTTSDGHQIGTICVVDHVPRRLTEHQTKALSVLSRHVVTHLELRRSHARRQEAEEELQRANASLEQRVRERTEELLEAHERLELAIRAANIGSWEWNIATGEVSQSAQWKTQLGYAPDEFPGTGDEWRKRTHPDDLAAVDAEIRRCLANPERDYECETRFLAKDGSWRWVISRARLHQDAQGKPTHMLGCHIDLTERRATEEHLRESRLELRALAAHLHTVREEEATRMARALHDELGASLTGLKFDVAWLKRQLTRVLSAPEASLLQVRLESLDRTLTETLASVRRVCRELRPALLDELGLAVALEWQCTEFSNRTGVKCDVVRPDAVEIDPARATALFRILQELLTNIARHAGAKAVRVEVKPEPEWLEMSVRDDGCGLPADAWTRRDRFGLMGIRERSTAAGGTAVFHSRPGEGTTVTVRIPLAEGPRP